MTTKNLVPAIATHPGTILSEEMEANGYSQIDLAKLIDIKRSQLNEIIKGKRNINADLALLLEKAILSPFAFHFALPLRLLPSVNN